MAGNVEPASSVPLSFFRIGTPNPPGVEMTRDPTSSIGVPCALRLGDVPSSIYGEYAPSPALKSYLVCAWALEIGRGDQPHRQRVLPNGCADIVWIGDDPPVVMGPMKQAALASSQPGTTLIGLRVRPDMTARVFGVPAFELAERRVPLNQLWHRGTVDEASGRLLEQHTAAGRVAVAQSFLAARRPSIAASDSLVEHVMSLISMPRHQRIDALATHAGVSERHLRRRFLAAVGYSPKLFQRILRFHRLLMVARLNHSTRLGHLAPLAGYADQAHMTREVREFAAVPPSALLGHVVSALRLSDLLREPAEPADDPGMG